MKNKVLSIAFLFALLSANLAGIAQSKAIHNSVYLEIGGNALFTSINYERELLKETKLNFHIGAGIYGLEQPYLTIPFGVNYLLALNNPGSYIEFGMGATYSKADVSLYATVDYHDLNYKNTNYWNYIPNVAFRTQTKRNVLYRFSISPVINHIGFLPFLGLSIGKSF